MRAARASRMYASAYVRYFRFRSPRWFLFLILSENIFFLFLFSFFLHKAETHTGGLCNETQGRVTFRVPMKKAVPFAPPSAAARYL